jgi:hypothetical protein
LPSTIDADEGVIAIETSVAGVPVPLKDAVCGLLFALSLKLRVPDLVPVALGEKVTEAVQLAPAASVLGLRGQVEVNEKSLRLEVILVMDSVVD